MSANTETTSQDVPSVSSQGAEPTSQPKGKTAVEPTALDIVPNKPNYNKEFEVEKPSPVADRGVGVAPSVESVPEEEASVPPFPSAGEGPSAPALHTGGEEVLYPTPLRSIEYVDISGDASSEETPLQRTRRAGLDSTAEAEQRVEPVPETEAPQDTGSLPAGDPASTSEAPAPTEAAGAVPASPTPASRSDNFDDMFSDTPPATGEAAGFGHLPIPRVTRAASRSTETGSRDSLSVVLVNEAFIRAQQEVDDLKGQLDAQGRETEKFQHLLQVKEDQLNRAAALSNLQPELEAAKAENLRLKDELAGMVEKNRLLEADKVGLSQDNALFSSRLGELEATISQLRRELDSVKTDAVNMAERHRLLESENAEYKDKLRVFVQKAEDRARICDELKTKFEETAEANDLLKAELESATQVQRILDVERSELVDKLAQAEADLAEALKSVEAAEAHTTIAVEYERWKSRRATLEQAQQGFGDLPALILEAKKIEEEAKRALDTDSEDSERTVSERSGSSCTG
ncbi:uncharacterized protein LOC132035026 [Lycium ferocissimum]|uniref:uncharacterized protein LOC132035026 n=1 Tax=Lycium ferocissimum TaxID=112874 RepID=UPI0028164C93|nr:uncharacterized protein LOC132035026 [Lycium ferocissimum]